MTRQCFNCGNEARPGYLTCAECERSAQKLRTTPGTLAYAIAHPDDRKAPQ